MSAMSEGGSPRRRALAAVLVASVGLLGVSAAAPTAGSTPTAVSTPTTVSTPTARTDRVATWGASADRVRGTLDDRTVRNLVHTSVGGSDPRVELSNTFGAVPVTFDSVYVGLQDAGADVVPGSNREVTFAGSGTVTVPPGAQVLSDPVEGDVPADATLAVSVHAVGEQVALVGCQGKGPNRLQCRRGTSQFFTRFRVEQKCHGRFRLKGVGQAPRRQVATKGSEDPFGSTRATVIRAGATYALSRATRRGSRHGRTPYAVAT